MTDLPHNSGDINWVKKTKKIKGVTYTAVLYSPNFGAGWSTWHNDWACFLLFDKGLVERVLRDDKDEIEDYIKDKTNGKASIFCGGVRDLTVKWIPQGVKFVVNEYDGSESITVFNDIDYFTA